MSYVTETGTLHIAKDVSLHCIRWIPKKKRAGCNLVIHHGIGEHSARYGSIVDGLEGSGYTIYSYDVRGHGLSSGKRGAVSRFEIFADDLYLFLSFIKERYQVEQPYLMGHSMGGVVVLDFALNEKRQKLIKGLLASAAAVKISADSFQKIKLFIARTLSSVLPNLTFDSGLRPDDLSNNKDEVKLYIQDPLVHGRISGTLASGLISKGEEILRSASKISVPIFIITGENDSIADPEGSIELFQRVSSVDKKLCICPSSKHEWMHETESERKRSILQLKKWLTRSTGAPATGQKKGSPKKRSAIKKHRNKN